MPRARPSSTKATCRLISSFPRAGDRASVRGIPLRSLKDFIPGSLNPAVAGTRDDGLHPGANAQKTYFYLRNVRLNCQKVWR